MKKVIITEEQEKQLINLLKEGEVQQMPVSKKMNKPYCVDPQKVLVVKSFLDKNFGKKGNIERIGANGLKETIPIASIMASTGEPLKNFYKEDIHDMLIEKFKKMFLDHDERDCFLKQVLDDWFDDKIGVHGNLSVNYVVKK